MLPTCSLAWKVASGARIDHVSIVVYHAPHMFPCMEGRERRENRPRVHRRVPCSPHVPLHGRSRAARGSTTCPSSCTMLPTCSLAWKVAGGARVDHVSIVVYHAPHMFPCMEG